MLHLALYVLALCYIVAMAVNIFARRGGLKDGAASVGYLLLASAVVAEFFGM